MYAEFYGLAAPAFQLAPHVRFFLKAPCRRAMAYMVYGLRHAQAFIVITGEVGAGKTILVNNLLSTVKDNSRVTANIVFSQLAGDDLLHLIAASFASSRRAWPRVHCSSELTNFYWHCTAVANVRC